MVHSYTRNESPSGSNEELGNVVDDAEAQVTAELKHQQQIMDRSMCRFLNQTLGVAFVTWRDWAEEQQLVAYKMRGGLLYVQQEALNGMGAVAAGCSRDEEASIHGWCDLTFTHRQLSQHGSSSSMTQSSHAYSSRR